MNIAILFAISAAWAVGYLFIGAMSHVPPITATAAMTIIATLVIFPAIRFGLGRPLFETFLRRPWVPVVMGATAIAVPNFTVVVAEQTVDPDLAAVLGTTVPIATILLTTFVTRETAFSAIRMLGVATSFLGLATFMGWDELTDSGTRLTGVLIMMSGGLVFALNGLFTARQARDLDAAVLSAWSLLFGAIYMTALAFLVETPTAADLDSAFWALLGEGVIGLGLAYFGYYVLVARAGPGFASFYAFLVPVLGVVASTAVLGTPVEPEHGVGLAIVLGGLFMMANGDRMKSWMQRPSPQALD